MDENKEFANINIDDIPEKKPKEIRIGGIIQAVNTRYDKKNRPWAIVELHDSAGKANIFVFNNVFVKTKELLIEDNCIFVKGHPSDRDEDSEIIKMIAGDIFPLLQVREKLSHHINVMIDNKQNDEGLLKILKDFSRKNKGRRGLILHLKAENGTVQRIRASKTQVNVSKDFIQSLRDVFGDRHVWIS